MRYESKALYGRIAPEAFQVVIGPLVLREDVDDDVPEIEQHPPAAPGTLGADRRVPRLAQRLVDPVGDRLQLPLVVARADHEEVGVARVLAQIDDRDVRRFL